MSDADTDTGPSHDSDPVTAAELREASRALSAGANGAFNSIFSQLEATKADAKLRHLREEAAVKKELMQFEFDLNMKIQNMSRQDNKEIEGMKEEGKDRREKMKADTKKFESSGNDILGGGMGLDKFNPQIN